MQGVGRPTLAGRAAIILFPAAVGIVAVGHVAAAWAQRRQGGQGTTTYQDGRGNSAGRSETSGNTTWYYDARGNSAGHCVHDGYGPRQCYDARGNSTGSAR